MKPKCFRVSPGGRFMAIHADLWRHQLAAAEAGPVAIAFNGDFHWFDVARGDFAAIESGTQEHFRLRGNVETEIAGEESGAGCGCAYPADVSDAEVSRSNEILAALRETARHLWLHPRAPKRHRSRGRRSRQPCRPHS